MKKINAKHDSKDSIICITTICKHEFYYWHFDIKARLRLSDTKDFSGSAFVYFCDNGRNLNGRGFNLTIKELYEFKDYHNSKFVKAMNRIPQGVAGLSQLIKICCKDVYATVLITICTLLRIVMNTSLGMASIMLGYLVFTILISVFQIRSQNSIRENINSQKNALDSQVCQSIANLELIRSMDAGDYEKMPLKPAISKTSSTEKKHHRYMGFFDYVKQLFKITFQVIILLASAVMISISKMDIGAEITVCLLFQQFMKLIDEVYRFMDVAASSMVKAKILTEVASESLDSVFTSVSVEKHADSDDIVLKNVAITDSTGKKTC